MEKYDPSRYETVKSPLDIQKEKLAYADQVRLSRTAHEIFVAAKKEMSGAYDRGGYRAAVILQLRAIADYLSAENMTY